MKVRKNQDKTIEDSLCIYHRVLFATIGVLFIITTVVTLISISFTSISSTVVETCTVDKEVSYDSTNLFSLVFTKGLKTVDTYIDTSGIVDIYPAYTVYPTLSIGDSIYVPISPNLYGLFTLLVTYHFLFVCVIYTFVKEFYVRKRERIKLQSLDILFLDILYYVMMSCTCIIWIYYLVKVIL